MLTQDFPTDYDGSQARPFAELRSTLDYLTYPMSTLEDSKDRRLRLWGRSARRRMRSTIRSGSEPSRICAWTD